MFFKLYSYGWLFQLNIWKIHVYSLYLSQYCSNALEKIYYVTSIQTKHSYTFPMHQYHSQHYIRKSHIYTITSSHKKCSNSNFTFHCSSPHNFQTKLQQFFDIYSDIMFIYQPATPQGLKLPCLYREKATLIAISHKCMYLCRSHDSHSVGRWKHCVKVCSKWNPKCDCDLQS